MVHVDDAAAKEAVLVNTIAAMQVNPPGKPPVSRSVRPLVSRPGILLQARCKLYVAPYQMRMCAGPYGERPYHCFEADSLHAP